MFYMQKAMFIYKLNKSLFRDLKFEVHRVVL
jgi:hypothetical protein